MWQMACRRDDAMVDGGVCVKLNDKQIAIFYLSQSDRWFAVQNQCPHQQATVLARGIPGEFQGRPKVSCPLHKHCFDLETGEHLGGQKAWRLETYDVRVEDDWIWLHLPAEEARYG